MEDCYIYRKYQSVKNRYILELCRSICKAVHAEADALLNCSREQTVAADLYLTGMNPGDASIHMARPCPLCARLIIQAGIKNVYLRQGPGADNYKVVDANDLEWCSE